MAHPTIDGTRALPPDLGDELLPAAKAEGFAALERLRREWEAGTNRFSAAGEALYAARLGRRLVGVCGLNRDPFANDPATGRLRRLYVLPEMRRQGLGRRLVERALRDAESRFRVVRVRTRDPAARAFYAALGFTPVAGDDTATHQRVLAAPKKDSRASERR